MPVAIHLLDEELRLIMQVVTELLLASQLQLSVVGARELSDVVARDVLICCSQLTEGRISYERL